MQDEALKYSWLELLNTGLKVFSKTRIAREPVKEAGYYRIFCKMKSERIAK